MKHHYGWQKDRVDERDYRYEIRMKVAGGAQLPFKIDLVHDCSPVEDQGAIGSCTANALVGNMEYLEKKSAGAKLGEATAPDLSRLFIYFNEREIEGRSDVDQGATLRDGIKSLHKWGVCEEKAWPYQDDLVLERPSTQCYGDAFKRRISVYESLRGLDQLKDCLASGFPFVFGFQVYSAFKSAAVAKTGVLEMPQAQEELLGGHAVMAVGYDDEAERFTVRNSWGRNWGRLGYFTIPYAYLENKDLTSDFWTIKK